MLHACPPIWWNTTEWSPGGICVQLLHILTCILTHKQALLVDQRCRTFPGVWITIVRHDGDYACSWPRDLRIFNIILQTILISPDFSCTEEVLTIISLLSVDSVLYNPPARRDEVLAVRRKFISSEGDHVTLLNIYRAFKKVSGNRVGAWVLSRFWLIRQSVLLDHLVVGAVRDLTRLFDLTTL